MALEDFVESEVGIAVAATALVMSPRVRGWLRQGAVYGLAGILKAGDAISSGARTMASDLQHEATSTVADAQVVERDAPAGKAPARRSKTDPAATGE